MTTVDKTYWESGFVYPLCPNESNVAFFKKNLLKGSTLLLGCTRAFLEISDYQMDIDPWYEADTVIQQDWTENKAFFDNIIGDGVLNLDCDLQNKILNMAQKCCNRLMVRYFNNKLPSMRVATCFIESKDMILQPSLVKNMGDYSFLIWDLNAKLRY